LIKAQGVFIYFACKIEGSEFVYPKEDDSKRKSSILYLFLQELSVLDSNLCSCVHTGQEMIDFIG